MGMPEWVITPRSNFQTSGCTILRWLSAMLLVPVPWGRRVWALPFLTVPMPSQRWADLRGVRHKSLVDARQMLLQIARWLPDRRIVAVADSGFSAIDLLDAVRGRVYVVTWLRLDARLFVPTPPRRPDTRGRPRRTGNRLSTLAQRLADPTPPWSTHIVTDWYGQCERPVELATGCAVWSHPGRPIVPLRWLVVRDPAGRFRPQAFLSTDPGIIKATYPICANLAGRQPADVFLRRDSRMLFCTELPSMSAHGFSRYYKLLRMHHTSPVNTACRDQHRTLRTLACLDP
ncbi:transposase [uncultured Sphingomonas sp.]|uniref:transposase n=1 Tax=uncultured Sphingomonas sp. TaxID=158754 RepID=UPI0035CC0781